MYIMIGLIASAWFSRLLSCYKPLEGKDYLECDFWQDHLKKK